MHWDKQLQRELILLKVPYDIIPRIIGIVAEQRQTADREGYKRGFNSGVEYTEQRIKNEDPRFDI